MKVPDAEIKTCQTIPNIPIKRYSIPKKYEDIVQDEIKRLLEENIIEERISNYVSPAFVI